MAKEENNDVVEEIVNRIENLSFVTEEEEWENIDAPTKVIGKLSMVGEEGQSTYVGFSFEEDEFKKKIMDTLSWSFNGGLLLGEEWSKPKRENHNGTSSRRQLSQMVGAVTKARSAELKVVGKLNLGLISDGQQPSGSFMEGKVAYGTMGKLSKFNGNGGPLTNGDKTSNGSEIDVRPVIRLDGCDGYSKVQMGAEFISLGDGVGDPTHEKNKPVVDMEVDDRGKRREQGDKGSLGKMEDNSDHKDMFIALGEEERYDADGAKNKSKFHFEEA
uniref:Uncharacterized protein n=1 Tax=Cannabis sativa TaxID=3483 RepID=A0A803QI26_CANSA